MSKQDIIDRILHVEGGYVNDPSDSGGETNYGIAVATARAAGYTGEMRDLTRCQARDIYSRRYWDVVRGDVLLPLSEILAENVFDIAVNMGVHRAGVLLQRALNALSSHTLVVDGAIGPRTLRAAREYLSRRKDDVVLCRAIECLQGAYYIELTERRPKDKRFIYGWIKQRIHI
jgi:lysozyme family protein